MKNLIKLLTNIISEQYDSEKLYDREFLVRRLSKAPREIKTHIKGLPKIECTDSAGEKKICTKIPEIVYVYLTGRY